MDLLIIGGTRFLGRMLAETALAQGHRLSLFNRGQTNPGLFPNAEHITGDRNDDLSVLRGRTWDAAIDVAAYFPRQVRSLLSILSETQAIGHYTFISSISVYKDTRQPGIDENYPTGTIEDESMEAITETSYGPLKALCERAAEQGMPGRTLTVRPGLIVGPYDPTDRFSYWPARIQRGGDVLAPGRPDRQIQFIDVRDLAEWVIRMIEAGQAGVYNADGTPGALSMEALLLTCKQISGPARLNWVNDAFLEQHGVGPWVEMPLWIPESDSDAPGFFNVNVDKAVSAGLTFRPLADTIHATLGWVNSRPKDYTWKAGLAPARERELLELHRE